MTRAFVFGALVVFSLASTARAQPVEAGRFEVAVGPLWIGRASFGSRAATETTAAGGAVPVFNVATALNSAIGVEARIGARVNGHIDIEAVGSYAGPHLSAVTSDVESGATFTSDEWVQQFTLGGALVWRFRPVRSRWIPFAIAGAQYMRQLHEQETLLVSGELYEIGGGVKYLLGTRDHARLKTIGVRVDVRAVVRAAGVNIDDRAHASPAIAASLFVRF